MVKNIERTKMTIVNINHHDLNRNIPNTTANLKSTQSSLMGNVGRKTQTDTAE